MTPETTTNIMFIKQYITPETTINSMQNERNNNKHYVY